MARPAALIRPNDYAAMKEVMLRAYPAIYRVALGFLGDSTAAEATSRQVLHKSLRVYTKWQTPNDAARWFAHYTVLIARRHNRPLRDPQNDLLLVTTQDTTLQLFLRTVRVLPFQQREAFLLHHGERFDLRQLATAMDCSTSAAEVHLLAATESLKTIGTHNQLEMFTRELPNLLAQLLPPKQRIGIEVDRQLHRYVWPRRLLKAALIALALIAALSLVSAFLFN